VVVVAPIECPPLTDRRAGNPVGPRQAVMTLSEG
jgi:hypothetical protein